MCVLTYLRGGCWKTLRGEISDEGGDTFRTVCMRGYIQHYNYSLLSYVSQSILLCEVVLASFLGLPLIFPHAQYIANQKEKKYFFPITYNVYALEYVWQNNIVQSPPPPPSPPSPPTPPPSIQTYLGGVHFLVLKLLQESGWSQSNHLVHFHHPPAIQRLLEHLNNHSLLKGYLIVFLSLVLIH